MIDAPPFDPPYFSVKKTEQEVRVIETRTDGSRHERLVQGAEAAALLADMSNNTPVATAATRSAPKKTVRPQSGMPPGATVLAVPFAEKDEAKKLGARWNAERRAWYVPAGVDVSLFSRWRTDDTDS
jgi:hypothetical protein